MEKVIQKILPISWCPPIPEAAEDPSEDEILSAADKLAILLDNTQLDGNPFCIPENLGILPPLWLQARLTLSLIAIQEKFARVLLSVAGELWLRGQGARVEDVLMQNSQGSHNSFGREARPSDELFDEIGWNPW